MRILKTLHWSRRRSGSGVAEIHLQQAQVHDNNNGVVVGHNLDTTKQSHDNTGGTDEMWTPGLTSGHHRELPVDVPDTLLQQAYANKVMTDSTSNLCKNEPTPTRLVVTNTTRSASNHHHVIVDPKSRDISSPNTVVLTQNRIDDVIDNGNSDRVKTIRQKQNEDKKQELQQHHQQPRIIEITLRNNDKNENNDDIIDNNEKAIIDIFDKSMTDIKETNVDTEYDYPFAKEDYPTILKTCSDASASPRSSSGRSDSTAAMDASLILPGKESPLYDARRIDLGSPCRPIGTLFSLGNREKVLSTSFDNPAYGLDLDLHQGLLMRSEEVTDLTRLIHNDKSLKKVGKKTIDCESDKFICTASTDDLMGNDVTDFVLSVGSSGEMHKNKKQSSSGYSTLRSDIDYSDRSFLVVGSNRSYREVAVDCPPDFVPVTKCHPIYPPPSRKIDSSVVKKSLSTDNLNIIKTDSINNNQDATLDESKAVKVRHKVRKLMPNKYYFYDFCKSKFLSSNSYPINNSTYNLSTALTYNKTLNCTVLSPHTSIPYNLDIHDKPNNETSFKRIESFHHQTNENRRNSFLESIYKNKKSQLNYNDMTTVKFIPNDDSIEFLENVENSALSEAYHQSNASRYYLERVASGSLPDLAEIQPFFNNFGTTWRRRHSFTGPFQAMSFDEKTHQNGDNNKNQVTKKVN